MHKGQKHWGGFVLALILITQPAYAASRLLNEFNQSEDITSESAPGHMLANALEPYLKSTAVIRQKFYEHLLQSEDFIRVQSLIEYLWIQRKQEN